MKFMPLTGHEQDMMTSKKYENGVIADFPLGRFLIKDPRNH